MITTNGSIVLLLYLVLMAMRMGRGEGEATYDTCGSGTSSLRISRIAGHRYTDTTRSLHGLGFIQRRIL